MPELVKALWPNLGLISCWTDGPSTFFANELKKIVGPIQMQGKGLLSTEAFVTIPILSQPAPALAIRSHFFEFMPTSRTEQRPSLLAEELAIGERYEVIVTTGGGLYRYRLKDEVQVVDRMANVPLMRFVGRTDHTMDMVGEKLSAAHVQNVLGKVFSEFGMNPTFAQVVPTLTPHRRYEAVITDEKLSGGRVDQASLTQAIEVGLRENSGYAYARDVGQLREVKAVCLTMAEAQRRTQEMVANALSAGVRLGDIKPQTISNPEANPSAACKSVQQTRS